MEERKSMCISNDVRAQSFGLIEERKSMCISNDVCARSFGLIAPSTLL
jgi:hypothetical protein